MSAVSTIHHALPLLFVLLAPLALTVAGCASKLSLDGEMVQVGDPENIKSCRLIGNTRISLDSVRARILSDRAVAGSLENEARNFARRIGGDTVLPFSEIEEAGQVFRIYACRASAER